MCILVRIERFAEAALRIIYIMSNGELTLVQIKLREFPRNAAANDPAYDTTATA